jgi:Tol biopolymer transport system component
MAVDASRETAAVEHHSRNYVMGWLRDGKHLLFASDRSGATDLWALPVTGGRAAGAARQVEAGIGSWWSLGLTRSGALYVFKNPRASSVRVSALDLQAGRLVPSRSAGYQHFISSKGTPYWSPDGKQLAFRFCSVTGGGPCGLAISSIETGAAHELWLKLAYMADFNGGWSADGDSFLTTGTDLKGRAGAYRIDIRTGGAAPVEGVLPRDILSPDEKRIFQRTEGAIVERDLPSGQQREIYRRPPHTEMTGITLSPDGRYVAFHELSEEKSTIYLVPTGGGAPRELLAVNRPEQLSRRIAWTPDSRGVIVPKKPTADAKPSELWLAAIDGERRASWTSTSIVGTTARASRSVPTAIKSHMSLRRGSPATRSGRWRIIFPPYLRSGEILLRAAGVTIRFGDGMGELSQSGWLLHG